MRIEGMGKKEPKDNTPIIDNSMEIENIAPIGEPVETEENQIINRILTREALEILENDDPRMAEIIRRRYFLEETQQQIADSFNLSKARISELEQKALIKLKKILVVKPLPVFKNDYSTTPEIGVEKYPRRTAPPLETPEPEKIKQVPLNFFICFRIKKFKTILVDFSPEFYKKTSRTSGKNISFYMLTYKNRGLPENQNKDFQGKVREAEKEIKELTGFSAENLLAEKMALELEYNSGAMSADKLKDLEKIMVSPAKHQKKK